MSQRMSESHISTYSSRRSKGCGIGRGGVRMRSIGGSIPSFHSSGASITASIPDEDILEMWELSVTLFDE